MIKRIKILKKKNLKELPSYVKINILASTVCFILILSLTIGYSVVNQSMSILSKVMVRADKNIRITGVSNFISSSDGYEVYSPKYDVNTVTTSVGLPNIDSKVSYTITITNIGNIDMNIKNITMSAFNNNDMTYQITGLNINDIVEKNSEINFSITFSYKEGVIPSIENNKLDSLFEITFEEYIPELTYVSDSMLLDLRGTDAPVNNTWLDRTSKKIFSLSNISYNALLNSYDFSKAGVASYGAPLIPETGDFTLETTIRTPINFGTSDDQAILSQISDSNSSAGRFKINYQIKDNIPTLLTFINETSANTNTFHNFYQNITPDTTYFLQLVRTNEKIYLYLDGYKISTATFSSSNKISQTIFKLGKWTNSTPQSFLGNIYSVRLYSRALDDIEILNNYTVDKEKYSKKSVEEIQDYTIKEHAIYASHTTNGDGLYENNGLYYFKGLSVNNYLKFSDNPDLYRIVYFDDDDSMKIVNISTNINKPFDESGNRNVTDSSYCINSSSVADSSLNQMYGCNSWQSITLKNNLNGTTGSVTNDSTSNIYLNGEYYNSLPSSISSKILNHDYYIGPIGVTSDYNAALASIKSEVWNGKIGLLTYDDVVNSTLSGTIVASNTIVVSTYLSSMLTTEKTIWLMNYYNANTWDMWTLMDLSGKYHMANRRASRYLQSPILFYLQPAFYISSTYKVIDGNGSLYNPYIIY